MNDQRKLEWVQRNREKKQQTRKIGDVAVEVVNRIRQDGFDPMMKVADTLSNCVDDEFRNHCRIAGLQYQTLMIHVDQPARISALQRRWSLEIMNQMRRAFGYGTIHKVDFRYGREGILIPPPTKNERLIYNESGVHNETGLK